MDRSDASVKYLSTLKEQISKNKNSIQLNSKISAFLINEGRTQEAIPYLLKILSLCSYDQSTRNMIAEFLLQTTGNKSTAGNPKYYAVRETTALGDRQYEDLDEFFSSIQLKENSMDMEMAEYTPVNTGNINSVSPAAPMQKSKPVLKTEKTVIFSKRVGEKIRIGTDVHLLVVDLADDKVRMKLRLPKDRQIFLEESYSAISESNKRAINTSKELVRNSSRKLKLYVHK